MEQEISQERIENYLDHIKQEYRMWTSHNGTRELSEVNIQMIKKFEDNMRVDEGSKYIKVVSNGSVHSFIVKKADKKFPVGTILKAASWAAPAKNFARGNIFDANFSRISWTGAL